MLAGVGALVVQGDARLVLGVLSLVGLFAPPPRLPAWGWPLVHGFVVALTAGLVLVAPGDRGSAILIASSILVAWLLVHRAWIARTGDDVRVALLLTTLLLLLGAVGTPSLWMAPLFLVYGALLPVALLRAELRSAGEGPPRGLEVAVGGGAGVLALVLFVALPRLDGGYVGGGARGAGFPVGVTLGDDALVSDDRAEVMRLSVTNPAGLPVPGPFYIRGRTLDFFTGKRWLERVPGRWPQGVVWDRRVEVWLEPLGGDLLFGIGEIVRVEGASARKDSGSTFLTDVSGGTARPIHYVAFSRAGGLDASELAESEAWVQLPSVDPRVFALAWNVAPEEPDPERVARALAAWLSNAYTYVEAPPPPVGDPLAWFLLDSRAGHCEYFASALAVLLRVRGIPARLVTGFHSGELGDPGRIVVRRGHAHAWVEVHTADGWVTVDPTPASALPTPMTDGLVARLDALLTGWHRRVVQYDMNAQFVAYAAIGRTATLGGSSGKGPIQTGLIGMFVVLAALVGGLVLLRLGLARLGAPTRRGPKPDACGRLYLRARGLVRRRGWYIPVDLPALAAGDWLVARVGPGGEPLRRLAELAYAARYGGTSDVAVIAEARLCVAALKDLPPPARPPRPPRPVRTSSNSLTTTPLQDG